MRKNENSSFTDSFTYFGILSTPFCITKNKTKIMKFSLYPQNVTKHDLHINKRLIKQSMYFTPESGTDSALRVENAMCWKKLFNHLILNSSKSQQYSVLRHDGKMVNVTRLGCLILQN